MARRDNQGIQIAMIVFILTTLLFMVTTYFGYSSTTNLQGELDKAKSDLSNASSQRDSADRLATNLKSSIGIDPTADDSTTEAQVGELISNHGQGLLPENQNLIGIIQDRSQRVTDLSQELAAANTQIQDLRTELAGAKAQFTQQLADAQKREQEAHDLFTKAEQDKNEYIARNDAANKKYVDDANQAKVALDQAQADAAQQVAEFQKRADDAIRRAEMRQDELNRIKKDTPDQYDGRVLGVVAATNTVLLSVGRAEGVRPKMTFTVYDADDSNVRAAKKKATIEVTRVISDRTSEARIIDRDYVTPIVKNDFIYSPIWSPGTLLGIALVGEMDIDQDGVDDREYIRNLVRINGGRIDAEDGETEIVGKMTVNTRYIVVGEGQLDGAASEMLRLAKELTIERMSVAELMDLMSPPGRARSLQFNGVLRAGDFAPKPRGGVTRESTGTTSFLKRTVLPRRSQPKEY